MKKLVFLLTFLTLARALWQQISAQASGPWELERPALVARVGNARYTRVCAFLFPDENARAAALARG